MLKIKTDKKSFNGRILEYCYHQFFVEDSPMFSLKKIQLGNIHIPCWCQFNPLLCKLKAAYISMKEFIRMLKTMRQNSKGGIPE